MTGWKRQAALACVATCVMALSAPVFADGTPAGTVIENTATISFDLGGTPTTLTSNTASVTVVERIDVSVSLQTAQRLVTAGSSDQPLLYTIANTGNGTETFQLSVNSAVGGDDFDPTPSATSIYFDTDASGDFNAGDVAYSPGSNDPVLAADASVAVFILNDIPGSATNGQRGLSELIVTAATGSGAPGTVFAGQGDGGVDAVVGATTATVTLAGEYLVSDVLLTINKSQQVTDPFGGSEPVPGATITYSIVVEVTAGTATGSIVRDAIPAFTTYVSNSLLLNTGALSDAVDADEGELDTSGAPTIVVRLGDLTSTDGVQTIEFQVVID
ncbi:MAG: hypothetical protein AAGF72_08565 [Pseudomonadota bacterium]